jgi:DNA uptake protein ComE-like DNA-binding protein
MTRHSGPVVGLAALLLTFAACQKDDSENASSAPVADTVTPDSAGAPVVTTEVIPVEAVFLDPNTAPADEIQLVPNLSGAAGQAVIAGRPYADNLALDRVLTQQRLTDAQKDSVFAHVWKPIDPNTASDDEIRLIPGVGDRMLREFKEYRPWKSAEQFRREIGKYVDETEVARLLAHTTLK